MMVQKNLTLKGLIAGIRSHPGQEDEYIHSRIREIRMEIQVGTRSIKSEGVLKLWYLHMLGYEVSFAFFSMVEVMSFPSLMNRRPGFFAAAACFPEETSVALLSTNLFRRILGGGCQDTVTACLALTCLASLSTREMARDLHHDVMTLVFFSKPSVRHRAILCYYRMIQKYPPCAASLLPRLKELLRSEDTSVTGFTVTLLLELAQTYAKECLYLVPSLFKLWSQPMAQGDMLKLINLFRIFCSFESRLAPKLQEPLEAILHNPKTLRSVEFEILSLVIEFFPGSLRIVRDCLERIKISYLDSRDLNLNVLGVELLSLHIHKLDSMSPVIQEVFQDDFLFLIIKYVSASDSLLRTSALNIVRHCTNPDNFIEICRKLVSLCEGSKTFYMNDFVLTFLELGTVYRLAIKDSLIDYMCILARIALFDLPSNVRKLFLSHVNSLICEAARLRPFLFRVLCITLWKYRDDGCISFEAENFKSWTDIFNISSIFTEEANNTQLSSEKSSVESGNQPSNTITLMGEKVEHCKEKGLASLPVHSKFFLAHPEVSEAIICLLGKYNEDIFKSLENPDFVTLLINLAQSVFGVVSPQYRLFLQIIRETELRDIMFPSFVLYLISLYARCPTLPYSLRCTAGIALFKISLTATVQMTYNTSYFVNIYRMISREFLQVDCTMLRMMGKLFHITMEQDIDGIQKVFAQFKLTAHPALQDSTKILYLNVELDKPFFDTFKKEKALTKNKQIQSNLISCEKPVTLERKNKFPLWECLIQKLHISVYGSFVGRSLKCENNLASQDILSESEVFLCLGLDLRCENHGHEILKYVKWEQLDTVQAVTLSDDLISHSKKTRFSIQINKKSILKGSATVTCRVSYECEGKKYGFLIPVYIPFYHIFTPLNLDEEIAAIVIKTQQEKLSSRATVVRKEPLLTVDILHQLVSYLISGLRIVAYLAHLHILIRSSDSQRVTALLIGSEWTPDVESSDTLYVSPQHPVTLTHLSSMNLSRLEVPLVFALVTCTTHINEESSQDNPQLLHITLTTRTNNSEISERSANDLCNLVIRVFQQPDAVLKHLTSF